MKRQWLASGWHFEFDSSTILSKYDLKKEDLNILRLFAGEGALTKEVPSKMGDRVFKLEVSGFFERVYKDKGPGELMAEGFPAEEIDRKILSSKGIKALNEVEEAHDKFKEITHEP